MSRFKKMDNLLEEFAQKSVPGCACTIMQIMRLFMKDMLDMQI